MVALALLARGYHIVLPPITQAGAVQKQWDEVYGRMVTDGFSRKVLMEGTGAKAGESYAWAIANPDKVQAHLGHQVKITGTRQGDTLTVDSVQHVAP